MEFLVKLYKKLEKICSNFLHFCQFVVFFKKVKRLGRKYHFTVKDNNLKEVNEKVALLSYDTKITLDFDANAAYTTIAAK